MRVKRVAIIILQIFCIVLVQALGIMDTTGIKNVKAASSSCTVFDESNIEAQNYERWGSPVRSYLSVCIDGKLMCVRNESNYDGVLIEYYDASYNLVNSMKIPMELPLFGAFYETDDNYFLLTGQYNEAERADVEVYRITKYDKSWNRITSVGLFDCNTTRPFMLGSARMDVCGNSLVIRTCREMYKKEDGLNHQCNMTIEVNMDLMEIKYSYTKEEVWRQVGHCFNQFVKVDNENIITLDHGDGYPRAFALMENDKSIVELLRFPGEIGHNVTGAAIGGLEISDSSYLVAGHSVVQDDENMTRETRNVFIASVPKGCSDVSINWLTRYNERNGTTTTPQLVKVNNNSFVLLWTRGNDIYYTGIDGNGNANNSTYHFRGNLSDCKPMIHDGNIIWYTVDTGIITFYEVNINDLSQTRMIQKGHQYKNIGVIDGIATLVCDICGKEKQIPVKTYMMISWNENGGLGSYNREFSSRKEVGDTLYYSIAGMDDKDIEIIVSNPDIVSCTPINATGEGILTMLQPGNVTITIHPKWNTTISETFDIHVVGDFELGDINEDGNVNLTDLMMCLNHVSKKSQLEGNAYMAADVNGDGVVNLMDLMRILNYVSKKITEL